MVKTVVACRSLTPESVLDTLLGAVRSFARGAPQFDDMTVFVLRYRGSPAV
jgi:serine phosphatase RsbU (regulator of sigma subunit)